MTQQLHYSNEVDATLNSLIESGNYNVVVVLVDTNTRRLVLPLLPCLSKSNVIEMPCGEENKTLETLSHVWRSLEQCGATRQSLLVNVGGGVVTDLGGLAAATFKRGIPFINVPTTLLAAVDAAVGGKTGINFNGLKNEIGTFTLARHVIISTCYFSTLPQQEIKSGFAEMLKHAMLSSEVHFKELMDINLETLALDKLLEKLALSVKIKENIVRQDPAEQGLRKNLNLGHTVGHAFEVMALERNRSVPHGYAVAWGLVVEAVLSHMMLGFPTQEVYVLASFVKNNYGVYNISCDDYSNLLHLMRHDKKSLAGEINCTLLKACGNPAVNIIVGDDDATAALDIYRDLMGI